MEYNPKTEYRRKNRNTVNKRVVDFETRMRISMECKAHMHAIKCKNTSFALKGKSAHYASAFTGVPVTVAEWERIRKDSSAHAILAE